MDKLNVFVKPRTLLGRLKGAGAPWGAFYVSVLRFGLLWAQASVATSVAGGTFRGDVAPRLLGGGVGSGRALLARRNIACVTVRAGRCESRHLVAHLRRRTESEKVGVCRRGGSVQKLKSLGVRV